ncbi:MAG: hypothetical protein ACKN9T_11715, partial [Candidatus Methylumidiphilus sp.]
MFPVIATLLGGGAAAACVGIARRRRLALLDILASPQDAPCHPTEVPSEREQPSAAHLLTPVRAYFERWDRRYQDWIQTHIDSRIMGSLRSGQMQTLAQGTRRELSRLEKETNRSLVLGAVGLGLIGLTQLTGWPLIPAVIALGLYNALSGLKEVWRVTVEEHRFSLLHLMLVYFLWAWFGGYYLVGTVGIIIGGLCQKFHLLTQTVTRYSLTHLLGEQPAQVWVMLDGVEIEIPFEQLRLGDILVLTAGQQVPVDGAVVRGSATVDQHRLTGESQPVEKAVGDLVLAATLVLGGRIEVRVEKTGAETAAARIGEVLERTVETQEIRIADQFKTVENTRWPMLAGGVLGWMVGGSKKAAAMFGCNFLLIQIPLRILTLLNGLGIGAERGIL